VASVTVPGGTTLPDAEIIERILAGERALFEILMRRHNQQLYRAARAVVNDESEVEDILQQAYFNAFTHLHQFEDRARFSTWMTRIVLNEAFARRRKRQQLAGFAEHHLGDHDGEIMEATASQPDPERQAYSQELRRVLEDGEPVTPAGAAEGRVSKNGDPAAEKTTQERRASPDGNGDGTEEGRASAETGERRPKPRTRRKNGRRAPSR